MGNYLIKHLHSCHVASYTNITLSFACLMWSHDCQTLKTVAMPHFGLTVILALSIVRIVRIYIVRMYVRILMWPLEDIA